MTSRKARRKKKFDLFEFFKIDPDYGAFEPEIDRIVLEVIKPKDLNWPGLAVAVRVNMQVVHLNCYGFADLETETRITPDTIFDLGSLSKQFTALAALSL